jgi:hypothetical protein
VFIGARKKREKTTTQQCKKVANKVKKIEHIDDADIFQFIHFTGMVKREINMIGCNVSERT